MSSNRGSQTRFWCFTSFDDGFLWYDPVTMEYCIQQEEVCPSSGRLHWQGTVVFDSNKRLSALKKLLPAAHWEPMRGSIQDCIRYCSDPRKRADGGLYLEDGVQPIVGDAARKATQIQRYQRAKDLAVQGNLDAIDPDILIRHLGNLQKLRSLLAPKPGNLTSATCPGVWLVGRPGSGKSTLAEQFKHYKKDPANKWFDGYSQEDTVVLDDVAPCHKSVAYLLKQLGHQFTFQGETKGGSVWLRPHVCIVTSQYMLHEVFEDTETLEALTRRYKSFTLPGEVDEARAYITARLPSASSDVVPTSVHQEV